MNELIVLALVILAGGVLFAALKALERRTGRPGLGMMAGATLVLVGGIAAAGSRNWWLAGLLFLQAGIFLYELRKRAGG